ncbi:MAG: hypothetical protein MJZ16_12790 [Bacteroidales bacterium]|nr:hypothetical protein [Bacteroidales bacterium]
MAQNVVDITKVHAVAGSSKLKATVCGHIYNIVAAADIDNGCIVGKGAWQGMEKYAEAAATTFTGTVIDQAANGNWYVEVATASNAYLVLTVPETYYNTPSYLGNEEYFYNAAGDIMRCYELVPGDIFELSATGFNGTPTKGAAVTVAAKKVKIS